MAKKIEKNKSLKIIYCNSPETLIESILDELGVKYVRGKLNGIRRTMDFIIPNIDLSTLGPEIIILGTAIIVLLLGLFP